jgi:hypothetical protein
MAGGGADAKLFQQLGRKVPFVIKLFNLFYHPKRITSVFARQSDWKPTRSGTVRLGFLFGERSLGAEG